MMVPDMRLEEAPSELISHFCGRIIRNGFMAAS